MSRYIFFPLFLFINFTIVAQKPDGHFEIKGKVTDKENGEGIIGVTVYVKELQKGTTTDKNGTYNISLPKGAYVLSFNFLGYEKQEKQVNLSSDLTVNIELVSGIQELNEVIVRSERPDQNVSGLITGKTKLPLQLVESLPAIMGESDIIRSLILLPGVSTIGEASTGINVRGGDIDQNLILLDNAPVFNPSHFFGFFSGFNSDAVEEVTLYKGGIPAQYGGRLSSVLDVQLKEGDYQEFHGTGSAGIVSAKLTAEGPITLNKTSFIAGIRTSYSDWVLNLISNPVIKNSSASFQDANLKISHLLSRKDKLTLSGYFSRDKFKFPADTTYNWNNYAGTFKWTHLFNERFHMNIQAIGSRYDYKVESPINVQAFEWKSAINYKSLRGDLVYNNLDKHKLEFGIHSIWYEFSPGDLKPGPDSFLNPVDLSSDQSREFSMYINDELKISPAITVSVGLRYSYFQNLGPGDVFVFDPVQPKRNETIVDTLSFKQGQLIQDYQGPEPRAAVNYRINDHSSIKLGFNRMRQYIHLISNTTASTPIDIWQTSNSLIKPQKGNQYSAGYFRNFNDDNIETSFEIYFKSMEGILDYKDGANLLLNKNLEADLLQGKGRAYGLELMVRKNTGNLTGWVSYTYSRSERKVNGPTEQERINSGNWYPSNYDKPHDFTVASSYRINKKWTFSSNFTYSTGRPVTFPTSKIKVGRGIFANYETRNQQRIPDYHRLDISFTLHGTNKKIWKGDWTFSIYNLYSRDNAYSVFFKAQNGFLVEPRKLSVVARPIPSLTYNFNF